MSVLYNKISAPVSIGDVKQVLGESSNDLGTLCKSNKINIWSKHKPVVSTVISPNYNDKAEWERHFLTYNVNSNPKIYGLDITIDGDNADAKDMYEDGNVQNYTYQKPSGAYINLTGKVVGSPYRLGDFEGYYHLATPLCTSNFSKDTYEEFVVGRDTTSLDNVMFYVDGTHNNMGGITFDDFKDFTAGNFVLCANVYNKSNGQWMGDYINNSIKLYTQTTQSTLDPDCDDNGGVRYKYVTVNFDKQTYWGKNIDVYLTLDWVKYNENTKEWYSEKKMIIPFDDQHYYKKSFKFTVLERQVQAYELQTDFNSNINKIIWSKINTPVPANMSNLFLSPFIHFKISRTYTPLRFYYGMNHQGYWIRTKFKKTDGTIITRDAETTTATKEATGLPYVDIPAAQNTSQFSTMDDLYIQINNIFGETELSKLSRNIPYQIEVYLCHDTDETFVGTFSLSYN